MAPRATTFLGHRGHQLVERGADREVHPLPLVSLDPRAVADGVAQGHLDPEGEDVLDLIYALVVLVVLSILPALGDRIYLPSR